MILPESLNSKFFAKCFDASLVGTNGQITANPAVPPLPAGVAPFTPAVRTSHNFNMLGSWSLEFSF